MTSVILSLVTLGIMAVTSLAQAQQPPFAAMSEGQTVLDSKTYEWPNEKGLMFYAKSSQDIAIGKGIPDDFYYWSDRRARGFCKHHGFRSAGSYKTAVVYPQVAENSKEVLDADVDSSDPYEKKQVKDVSYVIHGFMTKVQQQAFEIFTTISCKN